MSDDLIEKVAERMFEIEYPKYSPEAHPDHNCWSWQGDGPDEETRDYWRSLAAVAVQVVQDHQKAKRRPRGVCSICGREFALNYHRSVQSHIDRNHFGECRGSRKPALLGTPEATE